MNESRSHWSKATVKRISDELKRIRKEKGVVTPRTVLDAARKPGSILHKHFDWDDASAAEKYRLEQAGHLIRKVQVFVNHDGREQPMRTFLNVVHNDVRQYVPVVEIAKDPVLTAQVVQAARLDLEGWMRRYQIYNDLFSAGEKVKEAISSLPAADVDLEKAAS